MKSLHLLALLLAVPFGAAAQSSSGTLLAANRDGGSLSLVDLEAGVEMARIPIGPRIPHEVAVSPDGRTALTSEYGTGDDPGQRLIVVDIESAAVTGIIDLGPRSRPHSFVFLPDGRRAVATMEASDRLALVDTVDLSVLRTYPTGGRDGHMVRVSPDGARAYVTSRGAEGTLSVIELDDETPPVVIETGEGAEGLAVSPDGAEIWVVNRQAGTISIVDAERLEVAETIPSRPFAGRAEISAEGRVLVPNGTFGGGNAAERYLRVYDLESREVVAEHAPSGEADFGSFGIHIAGELAFVSDRAARSIAVYDLERFPESRVIVMDHADPDGLAWSPVRIGVMDR